MDAVIQLVGRLHPLVLHAPIGLLVALVALELLTLLRKDTLASSTRITMVWLTAISAAVAVGTGLLLAQEGGYRPTILNLHQYLAIGFSALMLIAAVALLMGRVRTYGWLLVLACLVMFPAGHFGASMTHGSRFLLEPFDPPVTVSLSDPAEVIAGQNVYDHVVQPILIAYCGGCHGEERSRGGLAMHAPEALLRGGNSGAAIVAGDDETSLILARMRLPLDHEDHMPPSDKPQPSVEEIRAIEAWVRAGASFDAQTEAIETTAHDALDPASPDEVHAEVSPPSPHAIAALLDRLVHVAPLNENSHLLVVDASTAMPPVDDADVTALLAPLRDHVVDLSLARSSITDVSLDLIAAMPRLERLNLSATTITDASLALFAHHPSLESLTITQTPGVTDASLAALATIDSLSQIYAWSSGLTAEAAADWLDQRPGLSLDLGEIASAEVLVDASVAEPDSTMVQAAVAAALTPVNTRCPVADRPIDPRYALVHDGRVIAFCCAQCLDAFVQEPSRYPLSP